MQLVIVNSVGGDRMAIVSNSLAEDIEHTPIDSNLK